MPWFLRNMLSHALNRSDTQRNVLCCRNALNRSDTQRSVLCCCSNALNRSDTQRNVLCCCRNALNRSDTQRNVLSCCRNALNRSDTQRNVLCCCRNAQSFRYSISHHVYRWIVVTVPCYHCQNPTPQNIHRNKLIDNRRTSIFYLSYK